MYIIAHCSFHFKLGEEIILNFWALSQVCLKKKIQQKILLEKHYQNIWYILTNYGTQSLNQLEVLVWDSYKLEQKEAKEEIEAVR